MKAKMIKRILGSLLTVIAALRGFAAQNPVDARGFNADSVYQFGTVDAVNTFNGGVSLTIPLGSPYVSGDRLKYSFTLSYSSAVWDHERRRVGNTARTESVPARRANAGFGFILSLGELIYHDHLSYVAPDGSEHGFTSERVHFASETPAPGAFYSKASDYMRLRDTGANGEVRYVVDLPDGTSKEFVCVNACAPFQKEQTRFELRRIYDPFGNEVTIERDPEPAAGPGVLWKWSIREQLEAGRQTTHYLTFESYPHAPYRWIVHELDLQVSPDTFVPGQPITGSRRAKYAFEYYLNEEARVYRSEVNTATGELLQIQPENNPMWVPMLKSVERPDGSKWQFQYLQTLPHREPPPDATDDWVAKNDNVLERFLYPTGGGVRYEWGTYQFPRRACYHPQERDPFPKAAKSGGVVARQLIKANGTDDGKPWRYVQSSLVVTQNPPGVTCVGFDTFVNTVIDPLANVTVNYFTTILDPPVGAPYDYGLPYASNIADPEGGLRRLSTKVYKCASTDPFDPAQTPRSTIGVNALSPDGVCGAPLRLTYLHYTSTGTVCESDDGDNGPNCSSANRRVDSQRTVFHDDGDSWILVDYSDYDGLGHYREKRTTGNFFSLNGIAPTGTPRGDKKTSRTNFNPGVQFSPGAQQFCCVRAPNEPWVLDTYDAITEAENTTVDGEPPAKGGVARTEYHFGLDGFLKQKRTLLGADRSGRDLVTTYERTPGSGGRVEIEERYYGGDGENLATTPLPINPTSADYVIGKVYRFGSLEKADYRICNGVGQILLLEQNEIDPSTGLTMSTQDASKATTTFLYDTMNRMTSEQSAGEARTRYEYTKAGESGANSLALVTSTREAAGTTLDPQVKQYFDPYGRLSAVEQRLPDLAAEAGVEGAGSNRWSRTETVYNENGWVKEQSTTGTAGSPNPGKITFNSYDPFGRVLQKTHADSTDQTPRTTTFTYQGSRIVTTVVNGTATASTSMTMKDFYDSQGRLAAVVENIGNLPQTVYEYDSSNRLVKVKAGSQTRTYEYDNRGFLLSEKHPELGPNGIAYGDYDARGNVHEVYYGSRTTRDPLDRTLVYDAAERVVQVKQPARLLPDGTPATLKSFTYYQREDGNVYQLGRLKQTQRHNWVYDQRATSIQKDVTVTETYQYWPTSRRLKSTTLTASGTPGVKFTTTFTYDDLGNVTSVDYPRLTNGCTISSTCIPAGPARTIQNNYTFGLLSAVPGFVDTIEYHANGLLAKVKHSNGAIWRQFVPANNLPRPDRIRVERNGQRFWTSGIYGYDAAGNISQIGTDKFTYDEAGRLVIAEMSAPTGTQNFSYDRFGNHKSFLDAAYDPAPATNRLPSTVVDYDTAGNVIRFKDPRQSRYEYRYEYDPFNMIRHMTGWDGTTKVMGRMFLYNTNDERVATIDYAEVAPEVRETWSARDDANRVIRDFQRRYDPAVTPVPNGRNAAAAGWTWQRDYVFRDGALAASVDSTGISHVHPDHLGSPRLTTNASGTPSQVAIFRPFGEEVVAQGDPIRLKFTGHERDAAGADRKYGDVDYMHGRYYNPQLGRFLSVDPGRDIDAQHPQSWNLYTYVRNSPIGSTDPTGRETKGNVHEAGATMTPSDRCAAGAGIPSTSCVAMELARREAKAKSDAEEAKRKKRAELEKTRKEAEAKGDMNTKENPVVAPDFGQTYNWKTGEVVPNVPPTDAEAAVGTFMAGIGEGGAHGEVVQSASKALNGTDQYNLVDRDSRAYNAGHALGGIIDILLAGEVLGWKVPGLGKP